MTRRALVVVALALCAACGSTSARIPLQRAAGTLPPTTTTAPTTTTTPPPPPTTVSLPPANAVMSPRGHPLPVDGQNAQGWLVETPCGKTTTLSAGTPIATPTVVLDPGHGGGETGAIGPNHLREAVVNLAVSQVTKATLEANGVTVVMTRGDDTRVVLTTRSALVRKLHPTAMVSIHHNSTPDGPRNDPGTEIYYQARSPESKRLSGLIYEEVVRALSRYQIPWVGLVDAGAKYRLNSQGGDYYHMLRETAGTPSVIAELAYISDPPEADLLARPEVQRVEGEAVARGILRYLRTQDPGSGYVTPLPRPSSDNGGGGENCVDPPL
ncbi:MAG: N-acetylmuramoyl-L-alanine amidase [Acidimicrobiia bacterium]|nr:N-acetylmuramoyl-L-alanine amidase [Acidimicrobiia bacterium]